MAGTTGLEPATSDVTGRRSNQLNYVPAKRNSHDSNTSGVWQTSVFRPIALRVFVSGKFMIMIDFVPRLCLVIAGPLLAWGQSGSVGEGSAKPVKPAEDKRIEREKGYHYAHPKNTGPTPESAKESNAGRDAKSRKKAELDATSPPTRTPETKSATPQP